MWLVRHVHPWPGGCRHGWLPKTPWIPTTAPLAARGSDARGACRPEAGRQRVVQGMISSVGGFALKPKELDEAIARLSSRWSLRRNSHSARGSRVSKSSSASGSRRRSSGGRFACSSGSGGNGLRGRERYRCLPRVVSTLWWRRCAPPSLLRGPRRRRGRRASILFLGHKRLVSLQRSSTIVTDDTLRSLRAIGTRLCGNTRNGPEP